MNIPRPARTSTLATLAAGDVVHIPAGTAHHVITPPGQQITYFIFKVQKL